MRRSRFLTKLAIAVTGVILRCVPTYADCATSLLQATFQDHHGTSIRVLRPKGSGRLLMEKVFDEEQVFLGISTSGHYYLNIGKKRIEGAYFPIPSFISNGRESNGFLIHFPNIKKEQILSWLHKNENKQFAGFSLSCTHTACSTLRNDFGIKLEGSVGPEVFSGSNFEKILENGFVDQTGKKVPFEIIQTSGDMVSLVEMRHKLSAQDTGYATTSAGYMFMTGAGLYYAGSYLFENFLKDLLLPKPKPSHHKRHKG